MMMTMMFKPRNTNQIVSAFINQCWILYHLQISLKTVEEPLQSSINAEFHYLN